jgi:hypothetical protein
MCWHRIHALYCTHWAIDSITCTILYNIHTKNTAPLVPCYYWIHIQNVLSRNDPSQNDPSHNVPSRNNPVMKGPTSRNDPSLKVPSQNDPSHEMTQITKRPITNMISFEFFKLANIYIYILMRAL